MQKNSIDLKKIISYAILVMFITYSPVLGAKKKKEEDKSTNDSISSSTFSALKWREIGPAFTSGRIADIAVNPDNQSEWYVASASGHVWKTINNGTTFSPIFDNYGAYSIGCVTLDPNNPQVVWVGTGENNHQRALGYGNGIYKSVDGGKSFKNMGLKESRQIGMIAIDHRNSDVVFVAAEGSAWGPGGERGLYKSTDGGETWKKVLDVSENTGVNNVIMDPRNPNIMYATSEQRRRTHFTKIGGGPESKIYKSTDGGENWRKLTSGLPSGHIGGMGIALSPANPDVVYAIIEAEGETGGFYRSTNMGESWEKRSDYSSSGQYYNEIYCDPIDADKVYSTETVTQLTTDGGKTWKMVGLSGRHVDDHALWIDPDDTNHFLIGGDGGVYESFDGGSTFQFKSNLPVTQFYRVAVDNDFPFYNVYGGTQDNSSFGGPSSNMSYSGVTAGEWVVTVGGDGFWQAIDPEDPNIVYSEWQYGNSVRYDKRSGEQLDIKPQERKGEKTYRWNWDAPMILSPHQRTRLYVAANKVFRSDDRGSTWKVISDDLTRNMDRNSWQVMGKFWSSDAVVKDVSTSQFGTIVALAESEVKEDLLYAGTDDGLIQVTSNAGEDWTKIATFPGVPEYTYVSDICPSKMDENVVFATFNNHKRDDFKPYVLKSTDRGKTWSSISNNLPENGPVSSIEQDYVNPDLLFAGTEFGVYASIDGGKEWFKLSGGMPDVCVKDITIQKRENDLIVATFGRGFYILDDYTPLRLFKPVILEKEGYIYPIKDALQYIQTSSKYGQGSTVYMGKNREYGATFTYFVKEVPKTDSQVRKELEKKQFEKGEKINVLNWDQLREESKEEKPHLIFAIKDADGNMVQKILKSPSKGMNRATWNLRYPDPGPVRTGEKFNPISSSTGGMLAVPGTYSLTISLASKGKVTELAGPEEFKIVALKNTTFPGNRKALFEFQEKVYELARTMQGAMSFRDELDEKVLAITQTLHQSAKASQEMIDKAKALEAQLSAINFKFNGHQAKASWEEIPPAEMPLNRRLGYLAYTHYSSTTDITQTEKDAYDILNEALPPIIDELKEIAGTGIKELEDYMEKIGAPWTPGRLIEMK